jgi:hypothetical protein
MRRSIPAAIAVLLLACGSDGGDGGGGPLATALTVTPAAGVPVVAGDAASRGGTVSCPAPPGLPVTGAVSVRYAVAVASNAARVCERLASGEAFVGSWTVVIGVARGGASTPAIQAPATYAISATPRVEGTTATLAFARVFRHDDCTSAAQVRAISGSIDLVSNVGGTLRGSVALALEGGGTVTGTFVAPACGELDAGTVQSVCTGAFPNPFPSPSSCTVP